ncbi:MAG: SDR family oxidoreductase [Cyclobacteriaceae bacterium]
MSYIQNRVVWITGASSGIGEHLAYAMASKGARLILSARRKEELERVKGNCPAGSQANIRILPLDLSEAGMLKLSTEAALQLFGHVDILVNNGGISQRSLAKETAPEVDRRIMEVDFFGTLALTKYLLPHFLSRRSGHFVTVSSVMGKIGTPYRSGYAAAKHALHGFFDSLRAELFQESRDIHVTLICPGWIRTNVTLNALTGTGEPLNSMDDTTDQGLPPEQCAAAIVNGIEKKKNEVYIGGLKEVGAVYLKRFLPGLFARIVRTAKVR